MMMQPLWGIRSWKGVMWHFLFKSKRQEPVRMTRGHVNLSRGKDSVTHYDGLYMIVRVELQ
jgi:hypothetical protein